MVSEKVKRRLVNAGVPHDAHDVTGWLPKSIQWNYVNECGMRLWWTLAVDCMAVRAFAWVEPLDVFMNVTHNVDKQEFLRFSNPTRNDVIEYFKREACRQMGEELAAPNGCLFVYADEKVSLC